MQPASIAVYIFIFFIIHGLYAVLEKKPIKMIPFWLRHRFQFSVDLTYIKIFVYLIIYASHWLYWKKFERVDIAAILSCISKHIRLSYHLCMHIDFLGRTVELFLIVFISGIVFREIFLLHINITVYLICVSYRHLWKNRKMDSYCVIWGFDFREVLLLYLNIFVYPTICVSHCLLWKNSGMISYCVIYSFEFRETLLYMNIFIYVIISETRWVRRKRVEWVHIVLFSFLFWEVPLYINILFTLSSVYGIGFFVKQWNVLVLCYLRFKYR